MKADFTLHKLQQMLGEVILNVLDEAQKHIPNVVYTVNTFKIESYRGTVKLSIIYDDYGILHLSDFTLSGNYHDRSDLLPDHAVEIDKVLNLIKNKLRTLEMERKIKKTLGIE